MKALLEELTDPTMRNNKFETPLDLAALYGRLEVVKLLLGAHPNLLSCSTRKHTPLHLAARNGHKAVVQVLLDAGMDSNHQVASQAGTRRLCWRKGCNPWGRHSTVLLSCVWSTCHITSMCFLPCVTLFCSDVVEVDELCGVSLVILLVSFQGMSWSLNPEKMCSRAISKTERLATFPYTQSRGHLFAPPRPQLPCDSALLSDGRLAQSVFP